MSEDLSSKETRKTQFDRLDLTPFEHAMLGSSLNLEIDGKTVFFNASSIPELIKDENTRKLILTPVNLEKGNKTLAETIQAREQGEVFIGEGAIFKLTDIFLTKYWREDINVAFRPGKLDQNGQLTSFEIYLSKSSLKVELPEDPTKELIIDDWFAGLVEYVGKKDESMRFQIKPEIKEKE